jgi:hypothetical protein
MKRVVLIQAVLLVAGALYAGDGATCKRGDAKAVQLTGTIACADGASGADCARVFRVANEKLQYSICDQSKANLRAVNGSKVKIVGKIVSCNEKTELLIEKVSEI